MIGTNHPLFPDVTRELIALQREGVELTADAVARAIRRAEARYEPRPERVIGEPRDAKAPAWLGHIPSSRESVVYYVRVGNRVKIGTTTNLRRRLAILAPEEVLATEPGNTAQERSRHVQFRALRTVGEWFRYEEPLVSHIEKLRSKA